MQHSKRALVAGHICLDIITQLSGGAEFTPGSLLPVGQALTSTGGSVPNTGLALYRLGIPVRLAGKVGDDLFGHEIRRLVEAELGTFDTGLRCDRGCASSYTIVLNPPQCDRTFLHCSGANDSFGPEDVLASELTDTDLFHFGYPPLMRRMYEDEGHELAELLTKAKQAGAGTSLDMARTSKDSPAGQADWEKILQKTLPQVDFFLPSIDELVFMLDHPRFAEFEKTAEMGVPVGGLDYPYLQMMGEKLLEMGTATVAIKLGSAGLYMRTTANKKRLHDTGRAFFDGLYSWSGYEKYLPCYQVEYAGATGAGDCTIAGFMAAVLRGLSPDEAMDCALGTGACNVEAPDALSGIPDWRQLQERIQSNWQRRPGQLPGLTANPTSI